MRKIKFLFVILILTCFSCRKDKSDFGDCLGDNCITASGFVYDRLTREPLSSADIKITYEENCGFCGTGCLFRKFEIGSSSTDKNGYFKTNFSTKEFKSITGSYIFNITFNQYMNDLVTITNNNQTSLSIESFLNPPAYLNLKINLSGTKNIEYFGLDLSPDSLNANSVGDYSSDGNGLFSDTTIVFKVPAERIIYIGYLLTTDIAEKFFSDTLTIGRFKTRNYQINE
jgi:hypothetical protein